MKKQVNDEMLKLCIEQGYVAENCELDGRLVYAIVASGKNPCNGCYKQCKFDRMKQDLKINKRFDPKRGYY